MAEVTVDQFRLYVFGTLKRMEPNLKVVKTLDYEAAEAHMQGQNLSVESILDELEPLYEELLTSGDWPPAMNKTDKKAPELNFVEMLAGMSADEANAFVQNKIAEATAAATSKPSGGRVEGPTKSKVCHLCGQEDHVKSDCPNKDAPTVTTLPATVTSADPQVVQFKGKWKFWCDKCHGGRWTTSHITTQHKGGKAPKSDKDKAGGTELNMAETDASGAEDCWTSYGF